MTPAMTVLLVQLVLPQQLFPSPVRQELMLMLEQRIAQFVFLEKHALLQPLLLHE